jgi:hypothetical protein
MVTDEFSLLKTLKMIVIGSRMTIRDLYYPIWSETVADVLISSKLLSDRE